MALNKPIGSKAAHGEFVPHLTFWPRMIFSENRCPLFAIMRNP
jgi:hypothetical protein